MKLLSRTEWKFLAGVTLVATVLRLIYLDAVSLWLDELTLYSITQVRPLSALLASHMEWDKSLPLFTFIQYPFTFIFEQDEFGVRFPAAIVGAVSVPAIYFLGRLFSVRTAVLASLLLTISYLGIYFSQEARGYSLMIFLCIICNYYWLRICFEKYRKLDLVMYVVSATALFYTHYYGILFVGVQALLALFYVRHIGIKNTALVAIGISALTSPWWPILLGEMKPRKFFMDPPRWVDILGYHRYLFEKTAILSIIGTLLILIFFFIRFRDAGPSLRNRIRSIERELQLALFGILPFVIAFWRSRTVAPMLYERCMLIALPSVIVLTALSADFVSVQIKRLNQKVFIAIAAVLLLVSAHNTFLRVEVYKASNKDRNREATAAVIELSRKHNLPVLVMGKNHRINSYYFERLAPGFEIADIEYKGEIDTLAEVRQRMRGKDFILFLFTLAIDEPVQALSPDYTLIERQHFPRDNYIYVFRRNAG